MAAVEKSMAKAFGLDGDASLRHANPWSVYTRIPAPAALVAAIWTYAWIGWWCVVPVAVVCAWVAVNPKVFTAPRWFLDRMALLHDDRVATGHPAHRRPSRSAAHPPNQPLNADHPRTEHPWTA